MGNKRRNQAPYEPTSAVAPVARGERPWAEIKPSAHHEATVRYASKHDDPPLRLKLPDAVLQLLQRLEGLQRIQAGEAVAVAGDADPILAACDAMRPGQTEASLVAAVGLIGKCVFRADDEIMIVTVHEADAIRAKRAETGIQPLSDIARERIGSPSAPTPRQLGVGKELQKIIDPDWVPINERVVADE